MFAQRNAGANARLQPEALAILASNRVAYVAGGESVQVAVTPEVLTALAGKSVPDSSAGAYFRYTQFGRDSAPDAPVVDSYALEAKNDVGAIIDKLQKSKSPEAAAAAMLAGQLKGSMDKWSEPVPQGDRSGGNQLVAFTGASKDAADVAQTDAENITAMRVHERGRANAARTTTRTEKIEYTDAAFSNATDVAEAWIAADLEKERMEQEREGKITAAKMVEEDKAAADVGAPLPPRPSPSAAAAYVAATYPGLRLGGGNDGAASQSSLWKPVSDSDGNLVVVLPHSAMGKIFSMTVGGDTVAPSSIGNGFRPNLRFPRPGGAYTGPFSIKAESGTWTGTSPGGKRTEPIPMTKSGAAIPVSEMPKPEVPAGQGE